MIGYTSQLRLLVFNLFLMYNLNITNNLEPSWETAGDEISQYYHNHFVSGKHIRKPEKYDFRIFW